MRLLAVLVALVLALAVSGETTIELNGSNAYVDIADLVRRFPQGSFTLAMWVYPTPGLSSGLGTVFAMNTATGDNVMSLSIDRGRNIYEYKDTGNYAASNGRRATQRVPQYQWHWVALTLEMGTKLRVYMGGRGAAGRTPELILSLDDAALLPQKLQSTGKFSIGTEWDASEGSDWLCGMVDEFRAWDQALQPTELSFFMNSAIANPTDQANMHLMAYVPFNEGKGTTTADLSNSKLVATLHGAAWVNTFTPYDQLPQVNDKRDRSVRMDGRRGFVVGDSAVRKLPAQVTAITVMAWALPDADGITVPEGCVIAFNSRTGENENMICYDTKSSMFYYKDNKKNVYMGAGECGTSPPGVWHHIAFTIDASNNGVLYIDAEPKATFKSSIRPSGTSRFSMGQEWDGNAYVNLRSSNHFAGAIDEVAVFNRALSGDEIKSAYGVVHLPMPQTGLVAYWTFDEGLGRQSADKSGFGNHAILRRGTQWYSGHSVAISSISTWLTRIVIGLILFCGIGTVVQNREQYLDRIADLAGSLFPTAKGYKVVPQGDEFGGLLDGDED